MAWVSSSHVRVDNLGNYAELRCPRCSSEYLHHAGVVEYARHKEDAKVVVKTTLENGAVTTDTARAEMSGNPSSRRDGLVIRFWCENCGGDAPDRMLELAFAQHKGTTMVTWRYDPAMPVSDA